MLTEILKYKIAIVDDDPIGAKILMAQLKKRFETIDYFSTSTAFLAEYEKNQYDLILLDIMIPEYSGTDVLKIIRTKYSNFELPVIMLSAIDGADEIVQALDLGANDYMTKPAHIAIATARIQTQLMLKKYHFQILKAHELETLKAIIVTYNHEINNPLTVALGQLSDDVTKMTNEKLAKAITALERIAQIVKSIRAIKDRSQVLEKYSQDQKMYKVK